MNNGYLYSMIFYLRIIHISIELNILSSSELDTNMTLDTDR